ncbi:MAG: pyruvate dehydrogenase (acetyl-transferring), homodimeric type, partial [Acidimicrobiales bacterium]
MLVYRDSDPVETEEWIDSVDALIAAEGLDRASRVLSRVVARARSLGAWLEPGMTTDYINTIGADCEPPFPGDEAIEARIRHFVRWNAAVMVARANHRADGIGGHLATYASAATLYEVGFNHFFRARSASGVGDQVYFQGHAAPGIYARAFLEGRLTEDQLDGFRQEVSRGPGRGLSSYPHPRL